MIIDEHIVQINDVNYKIQPFPATKGLTHLKKLTKVVAPSMAALLGSDGSPADLTDVSVTSIESAVSLLVQNMDKVDVEVFIKELVASVLKDSNGSFVPMVFDIEFMGNYGTLFKIVTEVVKVNYGDVFTSLVIAQG